LGFNESLIHVILVYSCCIYIPSYRFAQIRIILMFVIPEVWVFHYASYKYSPQG
jgi:hypothetical protein